MIFSTITQSGLNLTTDTFDLPSQMSNGFEIKFVQDTSKYPGYIPTVQAALLDSEIVECAEVEKHTPLNIDSDGLIRIGNDIMSKSGYLALSITLTKETENVVLPVIVYKVNASVGELSILPPDTDAWQQVVSTFVEELMKPYEGDIQQAINTANQANTAAQQVVNEANEKLEAVGTATTAANAATGAANTAASSANEAASSANTAAKATNTATSNANAAAEAANKAATAANNAAESVRIVYSGESAPTDETGKDNDMYIVTGSGDEAGDFYVKESGAWVKKMSLKGATSVYMGNDLQTAIDLAGACFYVGEDDESYHLGTYAEWVSAGKPAFPSE